MTKEKNIYTDESENKQTQRSQYGVSTESISSWYDISAFMRETQHHHTCQY